MEENTSAPNEPTVMRPKLNPEPTSITLDIREEAVEESGAEDDAEAEQDQLHIKRLEDEASRATVRYVRARRQMSTLTALAEQAARESEDAVKIEGRGLTTWGLVLGAMILSLTFSLLGWETAANSLLLAFWVLVAFDLGTAIRWHRARRRAAERARAVVRLMDTHVG